MRPAITLTADGRARPAEVRCREPIRRTPKRPGDLVLGNATRPIEQVRA